MTERISSLIPNDWKNIATLKFFGNLFWKVSAITIKVLRKLSNVPKTFKQRTFTKILYYISWSNLMDGRKPDSQCWNWDKTYYRLVYQILWSLHFFLPGLDLSIFLPSNTAIHGIGYSPNILCRRFKEQDEFHPNPLPHFTFYCKIYKINLG